MKNLALRLAGEDEIHGITKFSDWTREEFVHMVGGMTTRAPFDAGNVTVATPLFDAANVPAAFDWRAETQRLNNLERVFTHTCVFLPKRLTFQK